MAEPKKTNNATSDAQNAVGPKRPYIQPETTIGAKMDKTWGDFAGVGDDELAALNVQIARALNAVGIETKGAVLTTSSNHWGNTKYDTLEFDVDGEFSLTREFFPDSKKMEHAYFRITDEKKQGKGTSKAVHRALAPIYEKIGVKRITVDASLENGGYTWAKYGFRVTRADARDYARNGIKSHKKEAAAIVEDYFRKHPKSDRFPMYLLARQPWGEKAMVGTSWSGDINLSNPKERRDFYEYIKYKPKRSA